MVGAVLVRGEQLIGCGWHRRAGKPHAEVEAIADAGRRGNRTRGATLYVTLEPCCTQGRTPPCTDAIISADIKRVVVAATDPNPKHSGRGFGLLRRQGISVETGCLQEQAVELNAAFNHWIVSGLPLVTVKAAMTLDGKIATATGESKWITGSAARVEAMRLRLASDAILVGVNTIQADDPSLTCRGWRKADGDRVVKTLRRFVLDTKGRIPLDARILTDAYAVNTTVIIGKSISKARLIRLQKRTTVWLAPELNGRVNLRWVLRRMGREGITSLLVEGGGEVNASFIERGFAQRVAFFYAPKILGGSQSRTAVAGKGFASMAELAKLRDICVRVRGEDLFLTARIEK